MAGRMGGKRATQLGADGPRRRPGAEPAARARDRSRGRATASSRCEADGGSEGTACSTPTAPPASDVTLTEAVFAAEVKPHLVHEAVRAELNAQRAGTFATKSRGLVSGGRSKPWRQKGTGRARAGTIRAGQFTGGGHIFAKVPRSFELKVNRKAARAGVPLGARRPRPGAARSRCSTRSSLRRALDQACRRPDRRRGARRADRRRPHRGRGRRRRSRSATSSASPSSRPPSSRSAAVVWARSLLVSQAALPLVEKRAG